MSEESCKYEPETKACECVTNDRPCGQPAAPGDVACVSCRRNHEQPWGSLTPRVIGSADQGDTDA